MYRYRKAAVNPLNVHNYKVQFLNDETIKTKPLSDTSLYSLLVIGLIKNINPHFHNLKHFINECTKHMKTVKFYFLTNNNTDDSVSLLKEWCFSDSNVHGTFFPDSNLQILQPNGDIGNRTLELGKLRNQNFEDAIKHFGDNFDYTLILDTDLAFPLNVDDFLSCFELDEDWDIICANSTYNKSNYHYDNYALRLSGQPDNIEELYPKFKTYYGKSCHWIDTMYVFESWYKVKSAFGGAMLLKGTNNIKWSTRRKEDCEHQSLCSLHKNIFVNPKFTFMSSMSLDQPMVFIPRDAGFFSVFNFYMGTLTLGKRVYPYWNYDRFMKVNNNANSHFAYFTESDNCWLDYFEPISFYKGDTMSDIQNISPVTIGELAPVEFKVPQEMQKLFLSERFQEWRECVNKCFKKYIKPHKRIVERVENIMLNFTDDMIAVHFRHPSHCCEKGFVYLRDYYSIIDKYIQPTTKIFLATDTEFAVMAFQQKYGDKLIYNKDSMKTSIDNILEWSYALTQSKSDNLGFINGKGYELHCTNIGQNNTVLGDDVICDVLAISKCRVFVHVLSNLSIAVSYMNPNIKMEFINGFKT